ncbi:MAG TPA: tyrosine-type recombinase/integrase [Pyrinomonadaceae bacterium]|jgi:integrase
MGVYKRKGKWEVRLQMNGVRYYRQVPEAHNKGQALVAEATLRKEIYEGRYGKEGGEIGTTDFKEFCERVYLLDIRNRLVQWKNEQYKVRTLCRFFAGKRLRDITPMLVQGYKRQRVSGETQYGRKRQASTVRGEIMTLSAIFNMAIDNDLIGANPCRKVKWARGEATSRRDRVLTLDEERSLMPQIESFPEVKAAVVLALNTGLRRMGILTLKTSDVNFAGRTVIYTAKGGRRRTLPLNAEALAVLQEMAKSPAPGGFLFHNRTGNNLSAAGGAFKLAVERAGLQDMNFHDLRHTFATRVRLHADAYTVRDLLGHSKVDTSNIYVNTAPLEEQRGAVDALVKHPRVLEAAEKFHRAFTANDR